MYKCKVLFLLMFLVLTAKAVCMDLDSIYRCLDKDIDKSNQYIDIRNKRIDKLREQLKKSRKHDEQYQITFRLYREYKSYMNDSAIIYLKRCMDLADKSGNRDDMCKCRSLLAFQCSTTGMYAESLDILESIDTTGTGREAVAEYYKAYTHVFGELAYYSKIEWLKTRYRTEQAKYRNRALTVLDENSDDYLQLIETQYNADKDINKALATNDRRMNKIKKGSHDYAIVAFYRYMDYKQANMMDEAKYWLAEAALADVRNAVMDQAALWELANLLNQEGQLMRSFIYIDFAWESAMKFGTRMRSWQISPVLQTIDRNYQKNIRLSNNTLRLMVGTISFLLILLLILLFYVGRQRNRLAVAHRELSSKSEQLAGLNEDLRQANTSLDNTNVQLNHTVKQLNEQTRVKEEYIGRFMRQCSLYIDKNDNFRKDVNKMLKNRKYEELYKMTKSDELKNKELEDFYTSFDSAFLHLFPNFVNDFNTLLRPEERITVNGEYKLNTGLRIFALIRLGIEDSSTIAEFLHYSVNTIYNYRARIKNGAAEGRGTFESRVKKIGMPE